jgi:hypothetical protein
MEQEPKTPPRLISTLHDDFVRGGFFANFGREVREIEQFYLSQDEREILRKKKRPWRWAFVGWWILKNSVLKLTPLRRILLVIGLVLSLTDVSFESNGSQVMLQYRILGILCLLLVIILELKDKLLAHSELESRPRRPEGDEPRFGSKRPGVECVALHEIGK